MEVHIHYISLQLQTRVLKKININFNTVFNLIVLTVIFILLTSKSNKTYIRFNVLSSVGILEGVIGVFKTEG